MEILLTLNKGHFQQHFRCIMAVNEIRVLRVNNRISHLWQGILDTAFYNRVLQVTCGRSIVSCGTISKEKKTTELRFYPQLGLLLTLNTLISLTAIIHLKCC
jgi:hypothetical protein